jgi:hypothetical protein
VSTDRAEGPGDPAPELGVRSERFRRRGTVTAERLVDPREWTTQAGDVLRVRAGDWWVTDEDGVSRGVADAAFHESYRALGGSHYQRVGTVTARRTETRVVVQTQEGPATAEPGTWLVTDGEGHSWPVPADVFEAGYEPFDAP